MNVLALGAVGFYLVALLFVGIQGRRIAQSSEMFNVFGRSAGVIRATSGYLSLIGGGELLALSQFGYDNGLGAYWFLGGIVSGFLVLAYIGERLRSAAAAVGANTFAGYVAATYGRPAAWGLMVVYVAALGSLLTIQFIVGGQLLAATTGLPSMLTPILMGAVIISYLLAAGYVAVLSTDVLRAGMMIFVLVVIGFAVRGPPLGPHLLGGSTFTLLPATDGSMLGILGFFGVLCAGDVWQAAIASRGPLVFRRSMIWAAGVFLVIGSLIAYLGAHTRLLLPVLAGSDSALLAAATHAIAPVFAPLMALLIVGSVMATADTEIWVLATSALSLRTRAPSAEDEPLAFQDESRRHARWLIPVVTAAAVVLALSAPQAQALYNGLLILLTALAPTVLAMVFMKPGRWTVTAGIWGGILGFIGLNIFRGFNVPLGDSLIPCGCGAIGLLVGLMLDPEPEPIGGVVGLLAFLRRYVRRLEFMYWVATLLLFWLFASGILKNWGFGSVYDAIRVNDMRMPGLLMAAALGLTTVWCYFFLVAKIVRKYDEIFGEKSPWGVCFHAIIFLTILLSIYLFFVYSGALGKSDFDPATLYISSIPTGPNADLAQRIFGPIDAVLRANHILVFMVLFSFADWVIYMGASSNCSGAHSRTWKQQFRDILVFVDVPILVTISFVTMALAPLMGSHAYFFEAGVVAFQLVSGSLGVIALELLRPGALVSSDNGANSGVANGPEPAPSAAG